MERFRLTILVESRIRWKVYVRFGGEYWETYHRNMTRRRMLSLHNQTVKAVKTNFDARRAAALLGKLEKTTFQLVVLSKRIIALTREYELKYLRSAASSVPELLSRTISDNLPTQHAARNSEPKKP